MNIITAYNELKKLCDNFTTVDKNMSVTEVDQLIDILIFIRKPSYLEINALRSKIRKEYSDLFPFNKQFEMVLKWNINTKSYDDFKDNIIKNLYDKTIYDNIMQAIEQDKLHFNITDLQIIPKEFITYCINNFEDCKEQYDENDEDDYPKPPKCKNAELFLVNCLSIVHEKNDILTKIAKVSLPFLRLMPTKYVVFNGDDLLDQIYSYYTTRDLSPLIGAKRNLVVLEGNSKNLAYDYANVKNGFFYSCEFTTMTLEFPYLCYVYPESVSLYIESVANVKFKAYVGIDVIQLQTVKTKSTSVCNNAIKHTYAIPSKGPCTYISFSMGLIAFARVGRPSVKGRAVVLV